MKVKITTTVDVDPEAWAEEFNIESSPAAIRADVQTYFAQAVHDQLEHVGLAARRES